MRNGGDEKAPHGVNEVHLKRGAIAREALRRSLSDLRLRKYYTKAKLRELVGTTGEIEKLCSQSETVSIKRVYIKRVYIFLRILSPLHRGAPAGSANLPAFWRRCSTIAPEMSVPTSNCGDAK